MGKVKRIVKKLDVKVLDDLALMMVQSAMNGEVSEMGKKEATKFAGMIEASAHQWRIYRQELGKVEFKEGLLNKYLPDEYKKLLTPSERATIKSRTNYHLKRLESKYSQIDKTMAMLEKMFSKLSDEVKENAYDSTLDPEEVKEND